MVYWWSEEVAQARSISIRAKRKWTRARSKKREPEIIAELRRKYNEARRNLRARINKAKAQAWQELLSTVESDPWGMPYKIALKKLKTSKTNLTESIKEKELDNILKSLFPAGETVDTMEYWKAKGQIPVEKIYASEVNAAIKRKKCADTAPGMDGIKTNALRRSTEQEQMMLAHCFTKCLEEENFPKEWKRALLVLIPKEWPLNMENIKVRLICLLNELGKLLESIIVERINTWLDENPDLQLSNHQFGFRKGRSTCDALLLVKSIIEETWREGGVTIAVSIDIKNAFNSLPWDVIRNALRRKRFPDYIRRIVDNYLQDRSIEYIGEDGALKTKLVLAGVPQGSVLGPVLWNVGYDSVLQEGTNPGCHIICYADDTLILATAKDTSTAAARANIQVGQVLNRVNRLGLEVATQKTVAVCFPGKRKSDRSPILDIGGELIKTEPSMKYLGVILDRRLCFREHFEHIADKANRTSGSLGRLLPNLTRTTRNQEETVR